MLIRDAGWAAVAAFLYGWCCWLLVWGTWPASPTSANAAATVAAPVSVGQFGWPG
jgi:hypothetical protein